MKVSTASPCAPRVDSNSNDAVIAAGALTVAHAVSFADFDRYQPHQVRKRRAVWARLLPYASGCFHYLGRRRPYTSIVVDTELVWVL